MTERKYDDDEMREIFEAASREVMPGPTSSAGSEGLTLAELKSIGAEAGLSPARIEEAAAALALRRDVAPTRGTFLGLPLSVGRSVDLPRPLTDREWELLVADLRQTFRAQGRVGSHGSIREWTNGNLHAYVEPTDTGHRLRLGTTKGNAVPFTRLGAGLLALALVLAVSMVLGGDLEDPQRLLGPLMLGLMGGSFVAGSTLTLPSWARERELQMEHIAARALALTRQDPERLPAGE